MAKEDLFVLIKIDKVTGYAKGATEEIYSSKAAAEKAIPGQDAAFNYRVERDIPRVQKGRPLLEDARKHREYVRMNDEERAKLDYCSKALNKTKAEIIREGIDKVYQELQNK